MEYCKEYGTPFEVVLKDVEVCLLQLMMIYCQRTEFTLEEWNRLPKYWFPYNPDIVNENHPTSIWDWEATNELYRWICDYQDDWEKHRYEGKYLEDLCHKMTCICFDQLRNMLDNAYLASPNITVNKTADGGLRMQAEDSYGNSVCQKYIVLIIRNKVWVYLDDGRPMEESRDRMNMVCVGHGDSWEKIKAKLNEPDPMTHEELLEAFASHKEIKDSIAKYPEKVFWPKDKVCKHCGKRIVSLYYKSPAWTWEHLCGRAGLLYICPYCKEDDHFDCEIMN